MELNRGAEEAFNKQWQEAMLTEEEEANIKEALKNEEETPFVVDPRKAREHGLGMRYSLDGSTKIWINIKEPMRDHNGDKIGCSVVMPYEAKDQTPLVDDAEIVEEQVVA